MSDQQFIVTLKGVFSFTKRKWNLWMRASGEWHVSEIYTKDYKTFIDVKDAIKYIEEQTEKYLNEKTDRQKRI